MEIYLLKIQNYDSIELWRTRGDLQRIKWWYVYNCE